MNFDLKFVYQNAYGKNATPIFNNKREFYKLTFSLIVSSASECVENKLFSIEDVSFIHLFLYFLNKSGLTLNDLYNVLEQREGSVQTNGYNNLDHYLMSHYSSNNLFSKFASRKNYNYQSYKFVPSDCLMLLFSFEILNNLSNISKKNSELLYLLFEEACKINCKPEETDCFDKWAQEFISQNDIPIKSIKTVINNMLDKYASLDNNASYITRIRYEICKKFNSKLVNKLNEQIKQKKLNKDLSNLSSHLNRKIAGQEEALNTISDKIVSSFIGFRSNKKPLASFLLTGPTGVGKTETAKEIAKYLNVPLYTVDMTTFKSKTDVSRLTGASPNYVGYNDKNMFCDFIQNHPNGIILFDEIEKGHPDCLDIIMRMIDEGLFTNAKGEVFSLNNNIIICTTNFSSNNKKIGFNNNESIEEKVTSPDGFKKEIIGRFNAVIEYKHLTDEACRTIVSMMIKEKIKTFKANDFNNIQIRVTNDMMDKILEDANVKLLGARDLEHSIQNNIISEIANYIIKNKPKNVTITISSNGIKIKNKNVTKNEFYKNVNKEILNAQ